MKSAGCDAVAKQRSRNKPGIFAMIAKISLGLRKIRNHRENFASVAKFTVASENSQFRYLTKISLG